MVGDRCWWERGRGKGGVAISWSKFKEVVFKVDLECDFVVLKVKVTETVPFGGVGEIGNVVLGD